MKVKTKKITSTMKGKSLNLKKINESVFSKDYVDFLSEAGWRLEKKLPSNSNNYSDLLEDTEWKASDIDLNCSKHYRRDLDALS